MYKLIAIDLDGTLLNSYGQVSEKNKIELNKAKQSGAEIVIASGRSTNSVKNIAMDIGASNYIICGNGSSDISFKVGWIGVHLPYLPIKFLCHVS